MEKLDLFKGMTLNDEEMFVIHGGISIAEESGIICGGGCVATMVADVALIAAVTTVFLAK